MEHIHKQTKHKITKLDIMIQKQKTSKIFFKVQTKQYEKKNQENHH